MSVPVPVEYLNITMTQPTPPAEYIVPPSGGPRIYMEFIIPSTNSEKLPKIALVNVSYTCKLFRVESSKYTCETVGKQLNAGNLTGEVFDYLRQYRNATRSLCLGPDLLKDVKLLRRLLEIYSLPNSQSLPQKWLNVLYFPPNVAIEDVRTHMLFQRFFMDKPHLRVIVLPRIVRPDILDTSKHGKLNRLQCIYTSAKNKPDGTTSGERYTIVRHHSSLSSGNYAVSGGKNLAIQAVLYSPVDRVLNWYPLRPEPMRPMSVKKLYLLNMDPTNLSSHVALSNLSKIGFLHNACDEESALNEKNLLDCLVRHKVADGKTELKELIHLLSTKDGGDIGIDFGPTLDKISKKITGIETFCWHQDRAHMKTVTELIGNWGKTLLSLSWRNGLEEISYEQIAEIFQKAPNVTSFGFQQAFMGLRLQNWKYTVEMRKEILSKSIKLAIAISPRSARKEIDTLVFFVEPLSMTISPAQFLVRISASKWAVSRMIEAFAYWKISVKIVHLVPRDFQWPSGLCPVKERQHNAISFRIHYTPKEPAMWATKNSDREAFTVSFAEQLSVAERETLFLLGGSGDNRFEQFEAALINQHIPDRATPDGYQERYGKKQIKTIRPQDKTSQVSKRQQRRNKRKVDQVTSDSSEDKSKNKRQNRSVVV